MTIVHGVKVARSDNNSFGHRDVKLLKVERDESINESIKRAGEVETGGGEGCFGLVCLCWLGAGQLASVVGCFWRVWVLVGFAIQSNLGIFCTISCRKMKRSFDVAIDLRPKQYRNSLDRTDLPRSHQSRNYLWLTHTNTKRSPAVQVRLCEGFVGLLNPERKLKPHQRITLSPVTHTSTLSTPASKHPNQPASNTHTPTPTNTNLRT
jgi:hypothetical protein